MNTQAPSIETFFDAPTSTLTYVVFDAASKDAVVVDPVRDFDPASGKVSSQAFLPSRVEALPATERADKRLANGLELLGRLGLLEPRELLVHGLPVLARPLGFPTELLREAVACAALEGPYRPTGLAQAEIGRVLPNPTVPADQFVHEALPKG